MMCPAIISATPVRQYHLDGYDCVLLSDIVAQGSIRYAYILTVTRDRETEPHLHITLEENALAIRGRMASPPDRNLDTHFLCVFNEAGHINVEAISTLMDPDAFAARALRLFQSRIETPSVHNRPPSDGAPRRLLDNT